MDISDLIIKEDVPNFGDDGSFTFEFRAPSGNEYCATYRHVKGSRFNASSYELDHINMWREPGAGVGLDEQCTPATLKEVNRALRHAGFSVDDIFMYGLRKSRRQHNASKIRQARQRSKEMPVKENRIKIKPMMSISMRLIQQY